MTYRTVTLYRDDSTVQVVYDRVKSMFWTAGNTVLVIARYRGEGPEHYYIHWPRERFCWFKDEPGPAGGRDVSQSVLCACGYRISVTSIEEMDALAGATDAVVACPQCGEDNEFQLPAAFVCGSPEDAT